MHVRKVIRFFVPGYNVLLIYGYNLFRTELSRPLDRFVWGAGFRPLQSTVNNRVAEYGRPNIARVSVPMSMPALGWSGVDLAVPLTPTSST